MLETVKEGEDKLTPEPCTRYLPFTTASRRLVGEIQGEGAVHGWGHPKTSPLSALALLCAGTTRWTRGPATAQGNLVLSAALLAAWESWGCLNQSRAEHQHRGEN